MDLMKIVNEMLGKIGIPPISIDIFAITMFICTGFYSYLYSIFINSESFPLHTFKQRIIGVAVLAGVDVEARTKLYLYALIITGIIALSLIFFLEKKIDIILPEKKFRNERFLLTLLSIFGTANIFFGMITAKSVFLFNLYIILGIIGCLLTFIFIKKKVIQKKTSNLKIFDDVKFICIIFLAPIIPVFFILVILGRQFFISLNIFIVYYTFFLVLLLFLSIYFPNKHQIILNSKYRDILLSSFFPMFFYPISIPITNELQYWISQWIVISPKIISIIIFLSLLLISLLFFRTQTLKDHAFFELKFSLNNIIFPVLLSAFSLYSNYHLDPTFNQIQRANLFEHGLTSTVVQQLFDFGKIPNIHLVNPHGFSDIYHAIFYSIINGYQPIDCFLWNWITPLLVVIIGYFFVKQFVEGYVAFLMMVFLPLYNVFNYIAFFMIFVAIIFVIFYKNPNLINYAVLICSILLCLAWRIEAGVASLLGFCILSTILYYPLLKKSPAQLWNIVAPYLFVTIAIFGLCTVLYISLCIQTDISPISAINSVKNLYTIQEFRGTYPELFRAYTPHVALEYAILPLFALGILIFFIWIILKHKKSVSPQIILIAFIIIGTLFISQRATQRHSLIETFNWYFYPLIACSLPLLWYRIKKIGTILILTLILVSMFAIAHFPVTTIHADYSKNFFEFKMWENHETRIEVKEEEIRPVLSLTKYLNGHLHSNETYYDMSNYNIPFTLLRKEYLPNSLFQMIQTGDYYQNETIKTLMENRDRVPIVVTGGIQFDGVPNELRTYKISEYVFTHYKPIGKIDNFEIWIRDDLNSSEYMDKPQNSSLYRINFLSNNIIAHDINYIKKTDNEIVLRSGSNDPHLGSFMILDFCSQHISEEYTGFKFEYNSDVSGSFQLFYTINNSQYSEKHSVRGYIQEGLTDQECCFVLPVNIKYITDIRIDPPEKTNMTFKNAYLYPRNSPMVLDNTISRTYNLGKLPYIWGTFDTANPISNQSVQNTIFEGEIMVFPSSPISYSLNNTSIDKSSGNYLLLTLKSESEGSVTIEYGDQFNNGANSATINYGTVPSNKKENYLIRISSQWDWYANSIEYIKITPSIPITMYECKILKGD